MKFSLIIWSSAIYIYSTLINLTCTQYVFQVHIIPSRIIHYHIWWPILFGKIQNVYRKYIKLSIYKIYLHDFIFHYFVKEVHKKRFELAAGPCLKLSQAHNSRLQIEEISIGYSRSRVLHTVKPRPEAHMDMILFEEHRLDSTTTDITTALFIL